MVVNFLSRQRGAERTNMEDVAHSFSKTNEPSAGDISAERKETVRKY